MTRLSLSEFDWNGTKNGENGHRNIFLEINILYKKIVVQIDKNNSIYESFKKQTKY